MTIEERLVHDVGLTDSPELAGYIMRNGEMLNFSHEGFQRDMDHRAVEWYFKHNNPDASAYTYMIKFMRRGNIRYMCHPGYYYLEFATIPTYEQWLTIKEIRRLAMREQADFLIERFTSLYTAPKQIPWNHFVAYMERYHRTQKEAA